MLLRAFKIFAAIVFSCPSEASGSRRRAIRCGWADGQYRTLLVGTRSLERWVAHDRAAARVCPSTWSSRAVSGEDITSYLRLRGRSSGERV
jgi:hypothetical protein